MHNCTRTYIRRRVAERLKEQIKNPTVKISRSIMVWGAIRGDGKRTLVLCPDRVDSIAYQGILDIGLANVYTCLLYTSPSPRD